MREEQKALLQKVDRILSKSKRISKNRSKSHNKLKKMPSYLKAKAAKRHKSPLRFLHKKRGLNLEEVQIENKEPTDEHETPKVERGLRGILKSPKSEGGSLEKGEENPSIDLQNESEIQDGDEEFAFLTYQLEEIQRQKMEQSLRQKEELDRLEKYRDELKLRVGVKTKATNELGSQVVKLEHELANVRPKIRDSQFSSHEKFNFLIFSTFFLFFNWS